MPAADARAGAEVHEHVRGHHRIFVVLDDEDRVAHVAQAFEAREQPGIVPRVQADAGLVEDVQHADEAAADLPGEANPLGFTARERRGGAVEREVMQADVEQEAEPGQDFLQQFPGDQPRNVAEALFVLDEPRHEFADGHGPEFDERLVAHATRPGLRVEPLPVAARAAARRACTFRAASAAARLAAFLN